MSLKKDALEMIDNGKALDCMVECLKTIRKNFHNHTIPLNFDLIMGYDDYKFEDDHMEWCYRVGDDTNVRYSVEINYIIYEDDKYLMVDADNGCGDRHCNVLFLKEKQK